MPKVTWKELDNLLHDAKGILTQMPKIEMQIKKIKEELGVIIEQLHDIVLEQVNDGKK